MADFIGTGLTNIPDADDPRAGAGKDAHLGERVVLQPSGTVLSKTGVGANDWTVWSGAFSTTTPLDQNLTPAAQVSPADQFDTGLTITATPAAASLVRLILDGAFVVVAQSDAERPSRAAYFANPATPLVARDMADIVAGDKLMWNGIVAGVLLDTDDRFSIVYEV